MVLPTALSSHGERKVYEFVVRRFLACCSEDAFGESTTVDISWGPPNDLKEYFSASGLVVRERNYLEVYVYDGWSTHEIPEFVKGEEIAPKDTGIHEGQTARPGFLTEPELIALMDVNGIGTDATMAEHIAKIVEREYVFAQPSGGGNGGGGGGTQHFIPSTLGIALVTGYDAMPFPPQTPPLTKPFLRKEMEVKMKGICDGRLTREEVVAESLEMYRGVFAIAQREVGRLRESCERFVAGVGQEGDGGDG